jgi:hypothetical protein
MFLHVDENVPAEPEHPIQGAVPLRKLVGTAFAGCAAFAGAIDKVATARPAINSEAVFMAISQICGAAPAAPHGAYALFREGPLETLPVGTDPALLIRTLSAADRIGGSISRFRLAGSFEGAADCHCRRGGLLSARFCPDQPDDPAPGRCCFRSPLAARPAWARARCCQLMMAAGHKAGDSRVIVIKKLHATRSIHPLPFRNPALPRSPLLNRLRA